MLELQTFIIMANSGPNYFFFFDLVFCQVAQVDFRLAGVLLSPRIIGLKHMSSASSDTVVGFLLFV